MSVLRRYGEDKWVPVNVTTRKPQSRSPIKVFLSSVSVDGEPTRWRVCVCVVAFKRNLAGCAPCLAGTGGSLWAEQRWVSRSGCAAEEQVSALCRERRQAGKVQKRHYYQPVCTEEDHLTSWICVQSRKKMGRDLIIGKNTCGVRLHRFRWPGPQIWMVWSDGGLQEKLQRQSV